ncbi:MAG: hypothetical protein WCP70_13585, partial [Methanothrix sp.]
QRHRAHGGLTEDSIILLPMRNSEEPKTFLSMRGVFLSHVLEINGRRAAEELAQVAGEEGNNKGQGR